MNKIDLDSIEKCTCKRYDSYPKECVNEYTFRDKGKQVKLEPRNGEQTILIAIDNCLINDKKIRKCDSLFIYKKSNHQIYSFLTELKGKNHISSAFEQLSITRGHTKYQDILYSFDVPKNKQNYAIVSDVQLNKLEIRKLEKKYNIRVGSLLHSDPQSKIPDLKNKIKGNR